MKLTLISLITAAVTFAGLGLASSEAEAKRLGGGKSTGMSRSATPPAQQAVPPKTATPAPATAAAPAAAAAAGKRSWLGPIAGLAAGLGLVALLSHFGMGEGVANFLMIAFFVIAAVFLVRFLMRRFMPQSASQYATANAGAGQAGRNQPLQFESSQSVAGSSASAAAAGSIPADFDAEGFLRQAKLNFIRLQAANDRGDMDDIKSFTSPELFAEIQIQFEERGRTKQITDVAQLDAAVLEVVTEGEQHIVSVHFSGLISEEPGAAPAPFGEIWHLTKPVDDSRGWQVAGIQQTS